MITLIKYTRNVNIQAMRNDKLVWTNRVVDFGLKDQFLYLLTEHIRECTRHLVSAALVLTLEGVAEWTSGVEGLCDKGKEACVFGVGPYKGDLSVTEFNH